MSRKTKNVGVTAVATATRLAGGLLAPLIGRVLDSSGTLPLELADLGRRRAPLATARSDSLRGSGEGGEGKRTIWHNERSNLPPVLSSLLLSSQMERAGSAPDEKRGPATHRRLAEEGANAAHLKATGRRSAVGLYRRGDADDGDRNAPIDGRALGPLKYIHGTRV